MKLKQLESMLGELQQFSNPKVSYLTLFLILLLLLLLQKKIKII
jgi:uncharacterized membrane protein YcgQ (UPF0703/DUF1980 family)